MADWKRLRIPKTNVVYETATAVLITMPHSSDYDGFKFWHSWKSYCYFLLGTLDDKLREHYERILATSIEYWCKKGGFVSEEIMKEVEMLRCSYEDCGKSERYKNQRIVKFDKYPDDCDTKSFSKLPSYKRMCVCIMKNDYYCKYMGFGQTKEAAEKRRKAIEKYRNL